MMLTFAGAAVSVGMIIAGTALIGCEGAPSGFEPIPPETTGYIGAAACATCHANVAVPHARHPHSQALKPVFDGPPVYPAGPGIPQPPAGLDWSNISYVVDGYTKAANFVDLNGFLLTDGTANTLTQYNLPVPEVGIAGGFGPFLPGQTSPLDMSFDLLARRTTGSQSVAENGGRRQDNRPGFGGTWAEAGVGCEACHGPGSKHPANPSADNILLGNTTGTCAACHANQQNPGVISAADSLINGFQQFDELQAGPHQGFTCGICHEPHTSTTYDRKNAIRNECQVCHAGQNMALHQGLVFVRGDYTEPVTCESCHMPFVVRTAQFTDISVPGGASFRFGDTRSHVFNLDPGPQSPAQMFSADGTRIAVDSEGQASVSTCYVCQRCHNGLGNAFAFPSTEGCAFGTNIHGTTDTSNR